MIIKFNTYITESLRDKMTPVSDEEIRNKIKKIAGVNDDVISIKIWNPYNYNLVSSKSVLKSEKFDDHHTKITGDIIKVYDFLMDYIQGNHIDMKHYLKRSIIT